MQVHLHADFFSMVNIIVLTAKNLSAMQETQVQSIPGLERSPEEGHGKPRPYSRLENSMDRGAWWATVHGMAKSRT